MAPRQSVIVVGDPFRPPRLARSLSLSSLQVFQLDAQIGRKKRTAESRRRMAADESRRAPSGVVVSTIRVTYLPVCRIPGETLWYLPSNCGWGRLGDKSLELIRRQQLSNFDLKHSAESASSSAKVGHIVYTQVQ